MYIYQVIVDNLVPFYIRYITFFLYLKGLNISNLFEEMRYQPRLLTLYTILLGGEFLSIMLLQFVQPISRFLQA